MDSMPQMEWFVCGWVSMDPMIFCRLEWSVCRRMSVDSMSNVQMEWSLSGWVIHGFNSPYVKRKGFACIWVLMDSMAILTNGMVCLWVPSLFFHPALLMSVSKKMYVWFDKKKQLVISIMATPG